MKVVESLIKRSLTNNICIHLVPTIPRALLNLAILVGGVMLTGMIFLIIARIKLSKKNMFQMRKHI